MISEAVAVRSSPGILGVAVARPEERAEIRHIGIARDHVGKLALDVQHFRRRDVLAGFGNAHDHPDILGREKSFRHQHEQDAGERHRGKEDKERRELMREHDVEAAPVTLQEPVEAALDDMIDPAVPPVVLAHQEARAQHRGERQRYEDRDDDRGGDGDGEFVKKPADYAAHQQQRNEHGNQRDADR